MESFLSDSKAWAPALSAIAACIALIINAVAVRKNNRKIELDIFDRIHSKIIEIERRLYAQDPATTKPELLETWRGDLLNCLEYAAFLFNHNYVEDQRLLEYWADSIIVWHEQFFLRPATEAEKSNPNLYKELRKLYGKLKADHATRLNVSDA